MESRLKLLIKSRIGNGDSGLRGELGKEFFMFSVENGELCIFYCNDAENITLTCYWNAEDAACLLVNPVEMVWVFGRIGDIAYFPGSVGNPRRSIIDIENRSGPKVGRNVGIGAFGDDP